MCQNRQIRSQKAMRLAVCFPFLRGTPQMGQRTRDEKESYSISPFWVVGGPYRNGIRCWVVLGPYFHHHFSLFQSEFARKILRAECAFWGVRWGNGRFQRDFSGKPGKLSRLPRGGLLQRCPGSRGSQGKTDEGNWEQRNESKDREDIVLFCGEPHIIISGQQSSGFLTAFTKYFGLEVRFMYILLLLKD